jgi:hypothetical protein
LITSTTRWTTWATTSSSGARRGPATSRDSRTSTTAPTSSGTTVEICQQAVIGRPVVEMVIGWPVAGHTKTGQRPVISRLQVGHSYSWSTANHRLASVRSYTDQQMCQACKHKYLPTYIYIQRYEK